MMSIKDVVSGLLSCLCLTCGLAISARGQYLRGVNLAGAEFSDTKIPGVINQDFTYNSERSFAYFGGKGLNLTRIPIRWERIQPALGGPLDPRNLAALKQDIVWAQAHSDLVIIDVHNYGRYKINEGVVLNTYVIDNQYGGTVKVSTGDLADLWVRLSNEFKSDPTVYAYGLMNEPHDMGTASWKSISQAVLTAIRNNQDNKLILVPGDSYSSADRWPSVHGPASWIDDPAGNFKYEAHQYFDRNASGIYALSYDQELAMNPNLITIGRTRVSHFIDWCKSNAVQGFLGEYGIPNNDPRWDAVLDNFLAALDEAGMDGTYWAAGEWWGNYPLSVQPQSSFSIDSPLLGTLGKHLGLSFLTTVSAASSRILTVAPGSIASGYGVNLASTTQSATALPLPTILGGVEVDLTDSNGATIAAPLFFVSPSQINYLVPAELAIGVVKVSVKNGAGVIAMGTVKSNRVAPSLFSANSAGYGVAAALILRLKADGRQSYESVAMFDSSRNQFVSIPIDFGDSSDRLFLVLFGTGIRNLSGMDGASLQIGATVPISFAGDQGVFSGLDQVNAELPRSLAGVGETLVVLRVDGQVANQVTLTFR